jgi:hypothetical protein
MYSLGNDTVESSLFVRDRCSWISWVILSHSLHAREHVFIYLVYMNIISIALFISYPRN